jgi:hypothetical protein
LRQFDKNWSDLIELLGAGRRSSSAPTLPAISPSSVMPTSIGAPTLAAILPNCSRGTGRPGTISPTHCAG